LDEKTLLNYQQNGFGYLLSFDFDFMQKKGLLIYS